jgi:MOSC domain-containing protein YiiM
MSGGRIVGLQRSGGGVPKLPVASAAVSTGGLEGDAQSNLKYHGGPDRALCLLAAEVIDALRADGHPIVPGAAGENVTIAGLDWPALAPGTRLRLGTEAVIEITSYTKPCFKIAGCFHDRDPSRLDQKRHPGTSRLYARVLIPGRIAVGDAVVQETSTSKN